MLTRPRASGGYEYSATEASEVIDIIRRSFTFLPEIPEVFERWQRLAEKYGLVGKSVHDANVVATALAHGAEAILTLNERDFRRYAEVGTIVP